ANVDPSLAYLAWGDHVLVMTIGLSGSGARYVAHTPNGESVFWNKGRNASFRMPDGKETDCTEAPDRCATVAFCNWTAAVKPLLSSLPDRVSCCNFRFPQHAPARRDAEQQEGHDQECRREAGRMPHKPNRRGADEDTGVAESRDRGNGHVLRHDGLAADAGEEDRHDVRAADANQRIAEQRDLPGKTQHRERKARCGAQAAADDDVGAAKPLHDTVA